MRAANKRYYQRNKKRIQNEQRPKSRARYQAMTTEERQERGRRNREREGKPTRRRRGRTEQALLRQEVIVAYGGLCACCGTDFYPHLTLDHVNGGGRAERREKGGSALFRHLRREGFPDGFQVLCWNCNWTKHHLGRCPCSD